MNGFPGMEETPAFLVPHALDQFDLNDILQGSLDNPEAPFLMTSPTNEAQPVDVFGFGAFDRVFMTQSELDKAQEKLPAEEMKRPDDVVHDSFLALEPWTTTKTTKSKHFGNGIHSAILCFNFIQLGVGELSVSKTGLEWVGHIVLDQESQFCLNLPIDLLSDIRSKEDPEDSSALLLMTVSDYIFLQFKLQSDMQCSDLVNALKELKKENTGLSSENQDPLEFANTLDDWYRGRKLEIETERDTAIRKITQSAQLQLEHLEQEYQAEKLKSMSEENRSTCQLCYDMDEAAAFVPCGHRLCTACLKQLGYNQDSPISFTCPWDRKQISTIFMLNAIKIP